MTEASSEIAGTADGLSRLSTTLDMRSAAMQEAMVGHGGPGPVGAPQKVTSTGRGQMSLAGKAGARG